MWSPFLQLLRGCPPFVLLRNLPGIAYQILHIDVQYRIWHYLEYCLEAIRRGVCRMWGVRNMGVLSYAPLCRMGYNAEGS